MQSIRKPLGLLAALALTLTLGVGSAFASDAFRATAKLNVAGAVGTTGRLTVIKDLGLREPYNSTVELVSGEIGQDFAYYFARSEQIRSAVGLGVFVDRRGEVEAAGGYLIQVLGGLSDEDIDSIEKDVASLPHPTTMIRGGETPEDILARVFGDRFAVLDRTPVRFHCPCNRDRAERALVLGDLEPSTAPRGARPRRCSRSPPPR
jgi:molecular chaperone Hsp33